MRTLGLVHRYLGSTVGVLILLWCGSGAVMMYVPYPKLTEARRLQSLPPIDWRARSSEPGFTLDGSAETRLEMLAGRPVLSQRTPSAARLIDLETGASRGPVTLAEARAVAGAYAADGSQARLGTPATIELDQWTVSGQFGRDRPLYRFALGDEQGTELYVSSATGRLVQVTTHEQRLWNWLGSVPHWLYWQELRRNPRLWVQVIIAGSSLGILLTVSGLWLGARRAPRPPAASARTARDWHRLSGLAFGVFTLTWLVTGLLSVQPWGLLETPDFPLEKLYGPAPAATRVEAALHALAGPLQGSRFVSVALTPFDGEPFFVASSADGQRQRFDAAGRPAPLTAAHFTDLARRLGSSRPARLLTGAGGEPFDARDSQRAAPVYRIFVPGPEPSELDLDAVSGALVARIDGNARASRWLERLHRLDGWPWRRGRPRGDALVLLLLGGVASSTATGLWLGLKRLFIGQR